MGVNADSEPVMYDDAILPSQFAAKGPPETGERRLCVAVLGQAVKEAVHCRRTRWWIESHARGWPMYFEPLCEMLGLDPGAVREALRERGVLARPS